MLKAAWSRPLRGTAGARAPRVGSAHEDLESRTFRVGDSGGLAAASAAVWPGCSTAVRPNCGTRIPCLAVLGDLLALRNCAKGDLSRRAQPGAGAGQSSNVGAPRDLSAAMWLGVNPLTVLPRLSATPRKASSCRQCFS